MGGNADVVILWKAGKLPRCAGVYSSLASETGFEDHILSCVGLVLKNCILLFPDPPVVIPYRV